MLVRTKASIDFIQFCMKTYVCNMSMPYVRRRIAPRFGSTPSPCIKVCEIDDEGFCTGCKRTIDEIRNWMVMSDYEQTMLLAELKWRKHHG